MLLLKIRFMVYATSIHWSWSEWIDKMTRILITGASGLLGLNLALQASRLHDVVGVVNRNHLTNVPFEQMSADLGSPDEVQRVVAFSRPDWIIHCAALANLEECEKNPARAARINTWLPGYLAEQAGWLGTRFLHISTDAVFDGETGNYREEDTPNPLSTYARTKLEGEQVAMQRQYANIGGAGQLLRLEPAGTT